MENKMKELQTRIKEIMRKQNKTEEQISQALVRLECAKLVVEQNISSYDLIVCEIGERLVITSNIQGYVLYDDEAYTQGLLKAEWQDDFSNAGYESKTSNLLETYPELENKYNERFWIFTSSNDSIRDIVVYDKGDYYYYEFINYANNIIEDYSAFIEEVSPEEAMCNSIRAFKNVCSKEDSEGFRNKVRDEIKDVRGVSFETALGLTKNIIAFDRLKDVINQMPDSFFNVSKDEFINELKRSI